MVKLQVTLGYEITTKHSMVVTCFYMYVPPASTPTRISPRFGEGNLDLWGYRVVKS